MIFHRGSATRSVWDCNENQTDVPTATHNELFNLTIAPKPESGREIRISDKQSPCTRSQLEPRAGWKKTLKEQHFEKASDMDRSTIMATTIMTDMDRATFGNILSSPRCTKASLTIFGQEAIFGLGALSQRNHYIVIINNGSRFVNIGQAFNIITITHQSDSPLRWDVENGRFVRFDRTTAAESSRRGRSRKIVLKLDLCFWNHLVAIVLFIILIEFLGRSNHEKCPIVGWGARWYAWINIWFDQTISQSSSSKSLLSPSLL